MKPVVFHPEARAEFDDAEEYHEERRSGAGPDLVAEVEAAAVRIGQLPTLFPPHTIAGVRKCIPRRIPYTMYFVEEGERVVIVAFAHQRRQPDYWAHRLSE